MEMCVDICVDMRIDVCIGMCIDMCIHVCIVMCVDTSARMMVTGSVIQRHNYICAITVLAITIWAMTMWAASLCDRFRYSARAARRGRGDGDRAQERNPLFWPT